MAAITNGISPSAAVPLKTFVFLFFFSAVQAVALTLSPDPSQLGNGAHQSSIGEQCLSSLDCGANGHPACCAFLPQPGAPTIGICSGCGAAARAGNKQGCGFGDERAATTTAAAAAAAAAVGGCPAAAAHAVSAAPARAPAPQAPLRAATASARHDRHRRGLAARQPPPPPRPLPDAGLEYLAGNGRNAQFVTGRCTGARDCGAAQPDLHNVCCASVVDAASGATVGVCSGAAVGHAAPKLGCGFGDGLANAGLAAAAGGGGGGTGGTASDASKSMAAAPAPAGSAMSAVQQQPVRLPDPGLDAYKGNQQHKQFVSGACVDSRDCGALQADLANVCCASVMSDGQVVGVCSGSAVGMTAPKIGCGFGDGKLNSAG